MVVGINKKEPSFNAGINSLPIPGNVFSKLAQASVFLTVSGKNPKVLLIPNQATAPKIRTNNGSIKNFHLLTKHHFKIGT